MPENHTPNVTSQQLVLLMKTYGKELPANANNPTASFQRAQRARQRTDVQLHPDSSWDHRRARDVTPMLAQWQMRL